MKCNFEDILILYLGRHNLRKKYSCNFSDKNDKIAIFIIFILFYFKGAACF